MARDASILKIGYFPCPPSVVDLIIPLVAPATARGTLLDNFGGEGEIGRRLAAAWNLDPYFVEIETERAEKCARQGKTLAGPAEMAEAKGGWSAWVFNPPYDLDKQYGRLEKRTWDNTVKYALRPGTLAILILPEDVVRRMAHDIHRALAGAKAFQFPQPEYNAYRQVVVFGIGRKEPLKQIGQYDREVSGLQYVRDVLSADTIHRWQLTNTEPVKEFKLFLPNWQDVIAEAEAVTSPTWEEFMAPAITMTNFRPVMAFTPGHTGLMTAAGLTNGLRIGDLALRGGTRKYFGAPIKSSKQSEDGTTYDTEYVPQKHAQYISVLNLKTWESQHYDSHDTPELYEAFIRENLPAMTDHIRQTYPPVYGGNRSRYQSFLDRIHAPGKLPGREMNGLLEPQAERVAALASHLEHEKTGILVGEMGVGKAQPIDANVLTPTGWKTMGEIRVGDRVIGANGKPSTVLGVFPQGEKDIYRVEFDDDSVTECCDEHLWTVQTPLNKWKGKAGRTLTLRQIMDAGLVHANGNRQHFIPMVAEVHFEHRDIPLNPYLIGVLIGDGCLVNGVDFSTADREVVDHIESVVDSRVAVVYKSNYDYSIVVSPNNGNRNYVKTALRNLGLMGKRAESKFVPDLYKFNGVPERIAVLQGLLDTDGSTDGRSNIEFCTVSHQLALDVVFLVQSLGGNATIATKTPTYTYKGEKRIGQIAYRVNIALPARIQPFRLSRKAKKYTPPSKYQPTRSIRAVTHAGRKQAKCILVDAPDHLYVTDDFIVTHNTLVSIATTAVVNRYRINRAKVVVLCPAHLTKKWRREIETALSEFGARAFIIGAERIVNGQKVSLPLLDVDDAMRHDGPTYLIISKETAKNGSPWATRVINVKRSYTLEAMRRGELVSEKRTSEVVLCPTCGEMVRDEEGNPVIGLEGTKTQFCQECKGPLFTMGEADGSFTRLGTGRTTIEIGKRKLAVGFRRFAVGEYLNRRYAGEFDLILDECFPGNTPVETPTGRRPIKNIRPGDLVLSSKGPRRVTRLIIKPLQGELLRIKHDQGEFICTPNHRIFTQFGLRRADEIWKGDWLYARSQAVPNLSQPLRDCALHRPQANDMQPGVCNGASETQRQLGALEQTQAAGSQDLPGLQNILPAARSPSHLLLEEVQQPDQRQEAKEAEIAGASPGNLQTDEARQPLAQARCRGKDRQGAYGARAGLSAGQWAFDRAADDFAQSPGLTVVCGTSYYDGHQILEVRQAGHCTPDIQDRYRSRRAVSSHSPTEDHRPKEGENLVGSRVESVEILERDGDDETYLCLGPDQLVYNLEVEDAHNYFAAGILVSNCHETKGGDTDIGFATQDLISAARKVLLMTGTIYGGKASTLYFLAYRALRWFRTMFDFREVDRFIDAFGLRAVIKTIKTKESSSTMGYDRYDTQRQPEIPGTHPAMAALLLPYTVFLTLQDLGVALPPYVEKKMPVLLDGEFGESATLQLARFSSVAKDPKAFGISTWIQASLGWLDLPLAESFHFRNDAKASLGNLTTMPGAFKKLEDVANVAAERWYARGRRTLLYVQQVHKRDITGLLKGYLEDRGLQVFVLRETVPGDQREDAINRALKDGCQVMITNGSLVETGLDLIAFPTIIRVQPIYSAYKEKQQNRRSWRLGQEHDVEMIWAYYSSPLNAEGKRQHAILQEDAVALMAKKLAAMAVLDGDIASGLAAMDEDGGGFLQELIQRAKTGGVVDINLESVEVPTTEEVMEMKKKNNQKLLPKAVVKKEPIVIEAPKPKPVAVISPTCAATLVSGGFGILTYRNGGAPLQLSWLGSDNLPDEHKATLLQLFPDLPKKKPSARFVLEYTPKEAA